MFRPILRAMLVAVAILALALTGAVAVDNRLTRGAVSTLPRFFAPSAESYAQVFEVVKALQPAKGAQTYETGAALADGIVTDLEAGAIRENAATALKDYSDTNLQVAGVQEADIVKTDGDYLYVLSQTSLYIVKAEQGQLTLTSKVPLTDTRTDARSGDQVTLRMVEIFVYGDRLIALSQETRSSEKPAAAADDWLCGCYTPYNTSAVYAEYYDIGDRTHPRLLGRLGQSGAYLSSRMVGPYVYLVTSYFTGAEPDAQQPATYIPQLYRGQDGHTMYPEDISLAPDPQEARYLVVTGADARSPADHSSSQAVLGGGHTVYASEDSLYVARSASVGNERAGSDVTHLLRFTTRDGQVKTAASGSVKGSLLNQFSMDAHAGTFRIVTTENRWWVTGSGRSAAYHNETKNHLFVLDGDLQPLGALKDLARDERVYSVRFDGDVAYFVTFRQVDPLFTVDLTDPAKPVILSALKIPGFSNYLHPYGEGRLFGLGQTVDERTGRTQGLKLSMFDTSDPRKVSERHTLSLGGDYVWSEAGSNHKAILVSPDRSLIAFPAAGGRNVYLLYTYSDTAGFVRKGMIDIASLVGEEASWGSLRGLYIDEYLYVIHPSGIASYRLADLSACARLAMDPVPVDAGYGLYD